MLILRLHLDQKKKADVIGDTCMDGDVVDNKRFNSKTSLFFLKTKLVSHFDFEKRNCNKRWMQMHDFSLHLFFLCAIILPYFASLFVWVIYQCNNYCVWGSIYPRALKKRKTKYRSAHNSLSKILKRKAALLQMWKKEESIWNCHFLYAEMLSWEWRFV